MASWPVSSVCVYGGGDRRSVVENRNRIIGLTVGALPSRSVAMRLGVAEVVYNV